MLISMHVHGGSCFFHAHDFSMVMAVHACSWWFMWFMCFSDMFMFSPAYLTKIDKVKKKLKTYLFREAFLSN